MHLVKAHSLRRIQQFLPVDVNQVQPTTNHQVLVDMMEKVATIFARPEVQSFVVKYKLGYDFKTADSIINESEREAHNPNCWIRTGVRVGDKDDTRLNATPFMVWLQGTTDNDVGNFRVRHTLNPTQSIRSNEGAVAGLKQIRHRIINGESQRYDPFQCQKGRIQVSKERRKNDEGCTRKADPGSLYCVQCRPKNLSMHEREVTNSLQLENAEAQQFEVKVTPSLTLRINNPFTSTAHHADSLVELSSQINIGTFNIQYLAEIRNFIY